MKIGFSFGRCVDDILNGRVEYTDVIVIVARTRMEKVEQIRPVIQAYIWEGYISGDLDKAVEIGERLFKDGKLHQPRCFGVNVPRVGDDVWLNMVPSTDLMDENVKSAWKQFQTIERLTLQEKAEMPSHLREGIYRKKIEDDPKLKDDF